MKSNHKHTLYLIGGPARTGKTIIANRIMRKKHLISISTDATRAAIRKVLIGESHVSIKKISFKGRVEFRRPGDLKIHRRVFEKNPKEGEDALAWTGVLGLIEAYDRKDYSDILVEGVAVTPERVSRLKLKNLAIRAVFVGFGDESHTVSILSYSKKKNDWVQTLLKEHGGDDTQVKNWIRRGIAKSKKIERSAKKFGYGYFDITQRPFKEHAQAVMNYLLKR